MSSASMIELLPTGKLWAAILGMDTSSEEYILESYPQIKKIVNSCSFPTFDDELILKIKEKFGTTRDNASAVLEYGYNFEYNPEILTEIISYSDIDQIIPKFLINYTLNSYVSWIVDASNGKSLDTLSTLLDSLNFILESNVPEITNDIKSMAASAFFDAFTFFVIEYPQEDVSSCLDSLADYFDQNNELPSSSFDLLIKVSAILIGPNSTEISEKGKELLSIVGGLIEKHKELPSTVIVSLQMMMQKAFLWCDPTAISFFRKHIDEIHLITLVNALSRFPDSISELIQQYNIVTCFPTDIEIIALPKASGVKCSMEILDHPTFDSPAEPLKMPDISTDMYPDALLPPELVARLIMLTELVSQKPQYAPTFITAWTHILGLPSSNPRYYDIVTVFLVLISSMTQYNGVTDVITALASSCLFDERVTYFGNKQGFNNVNVLRHFVFQMALTRNPEIICEMLDSIARHPLVYAESLAIIMEDTMWHQLPKDFPMTLINEMYYYQSFEQPTPEINMARRAILSVFDKIIYHQNPEPFLTNPFYMPSFRTLIYEKPMRPYMSKILIEFAGKYKKVMTTIGELCMVVLILPPDKTNIDFSIQILEILYEVAPKAKNEFARFMQPLLGHLTSLDNSEDSRKYLITALKVLQFYGDPKFTGHDISKIETGTKMAFGDKVDKTLLLALFSLATEKEVKMMEQKYLITQPKIFLLILKLYSDTDFLGIIIKSITINAYSFSNKKKLLSVDFDSVLLDRIHEWANNGGQNSAFVKEVIQLFFLINSDMCSTSAIYRYISLFCPVNQKRQPRFFREVFYGLINRVIFFNRHPKLYAPNTNLTCANVYGLDNTYDSITFAGWFNILVEEVNANIFRLNDLNDNSIRCHLEKGKIAMSLFRKYKIETNIEPLIGIWTHIAVTIDFKEKLSIKIYCNSKLCKTAEFEHFKPADGPVDFMVGNTPFDVSLIDGQTRIGKVEIFSRLSDEEIKENYLANANTKTQNPKVLISIMVEPSEGNNVKFVANSEKLGINEVVTPFSLDNCFVHTMTGRTGISALLPLFNFVSLPYCEVPNNLEYTEKDLEIADPQENVYIIADLFLNLLMADPHAEFDLDSLYGFQVIANFLLNGPQPTYKLYLKFIEMIPYIKKQKSIVNFFSNIVYNFEIWIRCTPEDHLKVIRHWSEVLFPIYGNNKDTKLQLVSVIECLRVYYFYEPTENDLILHPEIQRTPDFNINKVRDYLIEMIYAQAHNKISQLNVANIVSIAASVNDEKQAIDMTDLLERIIANCKNTSGHKNPLSLSAVLQLVLGSASDRHTISCISTLMECCTKDLIKYMKNYDLTCFSFFVVREGFGSPEILDKMLSFKNIPIWMPLLCLCAINAKCVMKLLQSIKPDIEITKNTVWWVWPTLALAYAESQEASDKMAEFIIECDPSNWEVTFKNVQSFCRSIDHGFVGGRSLLKHIFKTKKEMNQQQINLVSDCIFNCLLTGTEHHKSIIDMCRDVYGYKDNEQMSSEVDWSKHLTAQKLAKARYKFSANNRTIRLRKGEDPTPLSFGSFSEKNVDTEAVFSPKLLHTLIANSSKAQNRIIMIDIDEDGNWVDKDLVVSHITLLEPQIQNIVKIIMSKSKDINSTEQFTAAYEPISKRNINTSNSNNDSLNQLIEFMRKLNSIANTVANAAGDDYAGMAARQAIKFGDGIKRENKICGKLWDNIWQGLTVDCAPWSSAVDGGSMHYKRDMILCNQMVPMKLRRNFRFKSHEENSRARDGLEQLTTKKVVEVPKMRSPKKDKGEFEDIPIEIITPQRKIPGSIIYQGDLITVNRKDMSTKYIRVNFISQIFLRYIDQKPNALEIYMINGANHFIHFLEGDVIKFIQIIDPKQLTRAKIVMKADALTYATEHDISRMWVNNKMSNFEYLMLLNNIAGRSFNYLPCYPIFPWLLSDYAVLSKDPSAFRDLSKPIGIQDENTLERLEANSKQMAKLGVKPFLFNTGPVYPKAICTWLVRQEPFTTIHISQHAGREFDAPEHMFFSIEDSKQSNEFLELIPEFFFEPEFLLNANQFDLGERDGVKIDDVKLPKWASSPFDFIYRHRKILETGYVRRNLHNWIDLIFGYKQKGEQSIISHNTYPIEMYPEAWEESNSPPESISATMQNVGQLPQQLFVGPHPAADPPRQHSMLSFPICGDLLENDDIIIANVTCTALHIIVWALTTNKRAIVWRVKYGDTHTAQIIADNLYTLEIPPKPVWCIHPNGFMIVSEDRMSANILRISKGTSKTAFENVSEITALSSDAEGLAAADKDGNVIWFRGTSLLEHRTTLRTYRTPLCAVSISTATQECIACSKGGWVVHCSLSSRAVERANSLNVLPVKVLTTQMWGFAVVEVIDVETKKSALFVYSVNGDLLKSAELNASISCWTTFSTIDGFDIVIFADSSRRLWAFEAYYPDRITAVAEEPLPSDVLSIGFGREQGCAVCICRNGSLHELPMPPEVKCSFLI